MDINYFLNKENINTLWDVISDEAIFKFLSRDTQTKIYNLFSQNIKGFFEMERNRTNNLIDCNKKYILLISNHIKKKYQNQPNKIKIFDEQPTKDLITYEEIQNDRKSQFEKDLQQRQQDFENIMMVKTPQVPEFADKYEDAPIKEIDKIIKEMTNQRNYDVENLNHSYNSDDQINNWLKSQETSLKTEKFTHQQKREEPLQSKFKETDTNKIISQPKKNVSWGNKKEILNEIDEIDEINEDEKNIFDKLKKLNNTNEILTTNENRITELENQLKTINNKMDMIIDLLKK
jgi:hypothetical protein